MSLDLSAQGVTERVSGCRLVVVPRDATKPPSPRTSTQEPVPTFFSPPPPHPTPTLPDCLKGKVSREPLSVQGLNSDVKFVGVGTPLSPLRTSVLVNSSHNPKFFLRITSDNFGTIEVLSWSRDNPRPVCGRELVKRRDRTPSMNRTLTTVFSKPLTV